MDDHIEQLWDYLSRQPDKQDQLSTLIPLEHPYVVPGGRFREVYYWDSFFTILGLLADGKSSLAENMVSNFADMLSHYKMIPNGNRIYYLTRSQPPFFALMVDIICRYKNDYNWGLQYLNAMETEYAFWMNGTKSLEFLKGESLIKASERVVLLSTGVLNRYYDFDTIPREESYRVDYMLARQVADSLRPEFYRNLRAAAESGWDFSSRWLTNPLDLKTINTTNILPVDLNCLLYFLEDRLSFFYELKGDDSKRKYYKDKAETRKRLINTVFWNKEKASYCDYNILLNKPSDIVSIASVFPLYFKIAEPSQASVMKDKINNSLLRDGGLVTTTYETNQQWDAPNGWAPLQWMAIKGLREYNSNGLADEIKRRWLAHNDVVYQRTGKMLEKYNVNNTDIQAGGGEYTLQDGFGWTNGVAAALLNDFDIKYLFSK
jgi:alpha,alpha-trehalase